MEQNCPECGNEIYKPYNYCNACGWEKSEEEKEKEKQKKEKTSSKKASKKEPTGKGKKLKKEGEPKKPMKIRCKCGTVIKIKTSKRPLKIKCPKCGRSGTLKGDAKGSDAKPSGSEVEEGIPRKEKLKHPSEIRHGKKKKIGDKKKNK